MALRSLIVDDNARFLSAARTLLEREGDRRRRRGVVMRRGRFSWRTRSSPDVALVDIDLGEESGFDVAPQRLAGAKLSRVVLISAYPEADFSELIAASPAVGFLPKADVSAMRIREVLASAPLGT